MPKPTDSYFESMAAVLVLGTELNCMRSALSKRFGQPCECASTDTLLGQRGEVGCISLGRDTAGRGGQDVVGTAVLRSIIPEGIRLGGEGR